MSGSKKAHKIIINFCPTGMIPGKGDTPHVPVSPAEIIEQTHQAYEKGITIAHLHARDKYGKPTWKSETYREIFEGVRKYCPGLIICGSTSGRVHTEFEKRSAVIELMPDMCSLTLSSLNFLQHASVNEPDMITRLAEKMKRYGVVPELECFDLGMINYGRYLIRKKIIDKPFYWNLIFGNIAGMQAKISEVGIALEAIPDHHFISIGGLGKYQLKAHGMAVANGLGVRVGLEDNIWWDKKSNIHATNIRLVDRVHTLIDLMQYTFMKSEELGNLGFYNQQTNE